MTSSVISMLSIGYAAAASSGRGALLPRASSLLRPAVRMMSSTDMQEISGFQTTYKVLKQGDAGSPVVTKGASVTVHATGVVVETSKKFWSTKDPGQQPFQYTAGVGQVITGCKPPAQICLHILMIPSTLL